MNRIAYANFFFYSIQSTIHHFNVCAIKDFLSDASLKRFGYLNKVKKLVIDHYDLGSERQEKMKQIGNG